MSFLSLQDNPFELKTTLTFNNVKEEPDPVKRHLQRIEKQMRGFIFIGFCGEDVNEKVADETFQALLKEGESCLEKNLNSECMIICQAMISYIFSYLAGRGKGFVYLEDYAKQACSLLLRTLIQGIDNAGKIRLYDFLKQEHQKLSHNGIFFTPDHFLEIFPILIINREMETDFLSFIESMKEQGKTERINFPLLRRLIGEKINYMENHGRGVEVIQEIESNRDDCYFFEMLIGVEIRNGNYSKAKELAVEATGMFRSHNKYGTWYKPLLDIALKTDDRNSIRFYAERLYWTSCRNMEYFRILKSTYHDKNEWKEFVEQLLNKIGLKRKFRHQALLKSAADILAEENYPDRLCDLLEDHTTNPELIDNYSSVIAPSAPLRLLEIYRKVIIQYAGKPGYKSGEQFHTCFEIMKCLPGGPKVVEETCRYLLNKYSERIQMVQYLGGAR